MRLRGIVISLFLPAAAGSLFGLLIFYLQDQGLLAISLHPVTRFVILGFSVGLISGLLYVVFRIAYFRFYLEEVKLSVPEFSEMTFKVNREYRQVAWNLFIETITRISTQPLRSDSGHLRESLESLYNLFSTTRNLLKEMKPSAEINGTTVELFAVSMLNDELRPYLSKWHPLLSDFEANNPSKKEVDWELNKQFREELEQLRVRIVKYAYGFGEIAGVANLNKFFE